MLLLPHFVGGSFCYLQSSSPTYTQPSPPFHEDTPSSRQQTTEDPTHASSQTLGWPIFHKDDPAFILKATSLYCIHSQNHPSPLLKTTDTEHRTLEHWNTGLEDPNVVLALQGKTAGQMVQQSVKQQEQE